MPLRIMQGRRGATPTVICDYCHHPITRAAEGNYQWRPVDEGDTAAMFFTHKQCCHPFEHSRGGDWYAIHLEWLLPFLKNTLKVNMQQTESVLRKFNC